MAVKYLDRVKGKVPSPRLKIEDRDGKAHVTPDHPDTNVGIFLLKEALGTTEPGFYDGLISQLINIG